ncbi:MAG: hypothetical protein CMF42_04090 [Legionellales bacterium]|nr:hypothetical protein [Legionellales bacterium]OUX67524.1 MAG: hypothetical protein CBD38_02470 [bacterium TMED178]|tara:strand:- start:1021 stop:1860 length:840 start_codon:yes stop_codon:yes gene_type:complete
MPSKIIKDITPDNIRGIIDKIVKTMEQQKSEASFMNLWNYVVDKNKVHVDNEKLKQFSNNILNEMIQEGLFNPTNSEIFDKVLDAIDLSVHTCLFIPGVLPSMITGKSDDALLGLGFAGAVMIVIGAAMLANPLHFNITPEMSWGILGAGLECFAMVAAPFYLERVDNFMDSLNDLSLKSADDVAMFFINKVQTEAEHSNPNQTVPLGLVESSSKVDLQSVKDFSMQMLDSLAKILPDADKEIFNKAIKVINDGSYGDIKSIDDLKAVELEDTSGFTNT